MMNYRDNTDWKKFFKKLALFIAALIVLDAVIGSVFRYYYFKQKAGVFYLTTQAINNTEATVLVVGSSRANHHYVSSVFENKLHASFYNCGRDGCNLIYYSAIISAVLERYTPKHIIIDITPDEFSISEEGKLAPLLPYRDNPAIGPYIDYNSKFEHYKLLSKMYPYNSTFTTILFTQLFPGSRQDDNGYLKLNNVLPFHTKQVFKHLQVDSTRIKILTDVLTKLKQRNVAVTLVISPDYYSFTGYNTTVDILEKVCRSFNNVNFFNYENSPAYASNTLFSDDDHLNDTGAHKFSEDLGGKLVAAK